MFLYLFCHIIVAYMCFEQIIVILINLFSFCMCTKYLPRCKFKYNEHKIKIPNYIFIILKLINCDMLLEYHNIINIHVKYTTISIHNLIVTTTLTLNIFVSFITSFMCNNLVVLNIILGIGSAIICSIYNDIFDELLNILNSQEVK